MKTVILKKAFFTISAGPIGRRSWKAEGQLAAVPPMVDETFLVIDFGGNMLVGRAFCSQADVERGIVRATFLGSGPLEEAR